MNFVPFVHCETVAPRAKAMIRAGTISVPGRNGDKRATDRGAERVPGTSKTLSPQCGLDFGGISFQPPPFVSLGCSHVLFSLMCEFLKGANIPFIPPATPVPQLHLSAALYQSGFSREAEPRGCAHSSVGRGYWGNWILWLQGLKRPQQAKGRLEVTLSKSSPPGQQKVG